MALAPSSSTDYKAKYGQDPATAYALYGVAAVQVILAAIAKSDGTRKGVLDAGRSRRGITIPRRPSRSSARSSSIDPKTGDVNAKDMSIQLMKGNEETFLKAWPVVG